MILQALHDYYHRLLDESRVVAQGFQQKDIPFVIVLDRDGRFIDLEDTRGGEGRSRRARSCVVPREVKRSGSGAWQQANLLWDNEGYVLGHANATARAKKGERAAGDWAEKQHGSFVSTLDAVFPAEADDDGLRAVRLFLAASDQEPLQRHPLWAELDEDGANLTFRLQGDTCLVCERPRVRRWVAEAAVAADEDNLRPQSCLVTGKTTAPARLHARLKNVRGAKQNQGDLVSFNLPAFGSYQKEQGSNAPVGSPAEFAYTTALNTLLARDSKQRVLVGDATAVFWAERRHDLEDVFADFFGEPAKGESPQDHRQLLALYRSPQFGVRPELDPATRFFVLGLAPNAARLAVRFWYAGTVGEVAGNLAAHFDDLAMVSPPDCSPYLGTTLLLRGVAARGEVDTVPPNLAGDFVKAILAGAPYPQTLLSAAVRRIRAEQSRRDKNGRLMESVTYPRAALIKAVLNRDVRVYHRPQEELAMALDPGNTSVGYRLGRLFALLEKVQEEASPGINATIRGRFYGSASSTPVVAFPHLMKIKNHHVAKLENRGRAVNLERLIGEVVDGITDFPGHLNLPEQGRFAVGYYHQRQDLFKKRGTV